MAAAVVGRINRSAARPLSRAGKGGADTPVIVLLVNWGYSGRDALSLSAAVLEVPLWAEVVQPPSSSPASRRADLP